MNLMKRNKSKIIFSIILLLGIFLLGNNVYAGFSDAMGRFVGGIIGLLISALGIILILAIKGLMLIAGYQHFIDSQAVVLGWVIIRDVCNMFFIVILMIIAFGTILNIPDYNYKKWLPKLVLMAILINFSKTICGILIDISQVAMLTFVNAFKDVGGANMTDILGISDIVTMAKNSDDVGFWTIVGAYFLGLIYMFIALIVIVTMMMMLVMRLVMIWIYVVLSPLAYLLSAFPGGAKYASQWWGEFIKNLIVGPVIAFFIWLSFAALQTGNTQNTADMDDLYNATADTSVVVSTSGMNSGMATSSVNTAQAGTKASTPGALIKFVIAIGMLIGGLQIAQSIGGNAGSLAGKGMSRVSKLGSAALGFAGGVAVGRINWAGRKLDTAQMWAQQKLGTKITGNKNFVPKSFNPAAIKEGWRASSEEAKDKYRRLYGGAANNWHDTINKYTDVRQYGAIRKSADRQAKDNEAASELDAENKILDRRKRYTELSGKELKDKKKELTKGKDEIINKYLAQAPKELKTDQEKKNWAEKQYNEDLGHLGNKANVKNIEDKIASNKKTAEKLRDVRLGGVGFKGLKGHRFEPVYGRSGDKENQKKEEQAMSARTGEDSFALVTELIKASDEKDATKIACAFKLLAKNNDLNEALKDERVASLMTAQNGILERMAQKGVFGQDAKDPDAIKAIKEDYGNNRVNAAYVQTLVQGMFDKAGASTDLAGRYANDIGNTAFAGGNGVAFGMADGDAASGNYEFSELKYENGKLNTSDSRKAATVGKFNTMESQSKMRAIHPDTLISENANGEASGISDDGIEIIRNLNSHDLGQISRMRADAVKKIGNSKKAMKDLVDLVAKLEAEGNQDQADNVKYFVSYIESKKGGKNIKDAKEITAGFDDLKNKYAA